MHIFGDPQRCDIQNHSTFYILRCLEVIKEFGVSPPTPLVYGSFLNWCCPKMNGFSPFFHSAAPNLTWVNSPLLGGFLVGNRTQASPFSGSPRVGWCVPKTQGNPRVAVGTDEWKFREFFGVGYDWIMNLCCCCCCCCCCCFQWEITIYESMYGGKLEEQNVEVAGLGQLSGGNLWWVWWVGKGWGSGQVIWMKVWSISELLPSGIEVFKDNEHVCMFACCGMHSFELDIFKLRLSCEHDASNGEIAKGSSAALWT